MELVWAMGIIGAEREGKGEVLEMGGGLELKETRTGTKKSTKFIKSNFVILFKEYAQD